MNINHQFKSSNSVNASSTKKYNDADHYVGECRCNCSFKLNLLSEQIAKMDQKICIIVRLMEIPVLQIDNMLGISHPNSHSQLRETKNQEQKQVQDQSFLLQGIESNETATSGLALNGKNSSFKSNLLVGKEIAWLKSRMQQIQQKCEQIPKLRKNFSLLTKIVEKIGYKLEVQSNGQKERTENESSHSNCKPNSEDQVKGLDKIALSAIRQRQEKIGKESTPQKVLELRLGKWKRESGSKQR